MSPQPDVMNLLEAARPVHLDPMPDSQRRQNDLARALAEPTQLSRGGTRRAIRPIRVIYGLTAAAAVAAIAVATTNGPTEPVSGPSATGSSADSESASQILLTAANQVLTSSTSGRFWRTTSDIYGLDLAGPAKAPYVIRSGDREQNWVARSDSNPSWGAHQGLGRKPLSAADKAAWKADGSPTTFAVHESGRKGDTIANLPGAPTKQVVDLFNPDSEVFFVGHSLTMRAVRALPADQTALRTFLLTDLARNMKVRDQKHGVMAANGQSTGAALTEDEWLFSTATDLLTLPVAPEVRASAYRIMAGLKGVKSLGSVKDVTGRTGKAVAVRGSDANGVFETRIVINAKSGLLMADEIRYTKPAAALSWLKPTDVFQTTVVTDIGWTNDKPPAKTKYVPSGTAVG